MNGYSFLRLQKCLLIFIITKKSWGRMEIIPTEKEVLKEVKTTLIHTNHIEYFLTTLGIGDPNDPERPHDIYGPYHKFTWEWIKGHALQYRRDPNLEHYIQASIELHREQTHHRLWNNPNHTASEDDMRLGAVDAICSLLEGREYQGGPHTYEEIPDICKDKSKPHQVKWIEEMLREMQLIEQPNLTLIKKSPIICFPNIGLPDQTYNRIVLATEDVMEMLKEKGYNITS